MEIRNGLSYGKMLSRGNGLSYGKWISYGNGLFYENWFFIETSFIMETWNMLSYENMKMGLLRKLALSKETGPPTKTGFFMKIWKRAFLWKYGNMLSYRLKHAFLRK